MMVSNMGEIASLTDKLALMPDRMLPRLAQQYKSDAITLSLILGEKTRREHMRNSIKLQAAGQQAPKVNDQVVAGMQQPQLPEDVGIGALPTPNMQHMADGGIAGYADGDLIAENEPVVRMAEGGVARYQVGGVTRSMVDQAYQDWMSSQPSWFQQSTPLTAQREAAAKARYEQLLSAYQAQPSNVQPGAPTGGLATGLPYDPRTATRRSEYETAPKADTTGQGGLPDLTAAKTDVPTTARSAPRTLTAAQAKEQAKQFSDFGPAKDELQAAKDTAEASAAKMRETLAAGLPKTPALEGLEKLLDKQEAETGGEKEKAAGLALLTAGLAIAGGSSRFALQNLKEAIPAVTQYGDALKDIKKMERENMKMRGEIEQARRAEARDDTKLKLQLEEKIADRRDKINELGIGLTSKIADTDARTATTLWTTSQEVASRERTAGASANAQLNLFRQLGEAPAGSPLRKGFELYKQEGAEPTMYANYVKLSSDPMTGEAFLKKYPTFEVYKAGMGGQGQFYSGNDVIPAAVRTR